MIGLGSNRLTVCRRGGMSIMQFGMAGMSRTNDFFGSPYSAQATAALKAQFQTQWPTIRDYGFAHPALVPFINEDPMLVCSLIPSLGVRRSAETLGEGLYILGFKPNQDTEVYMDCESQETWGRFFMAGINNSIYCYGLYNGGSAAWDNYNDDTRIGEWIHAGVHHIEKTKNGLIVDGTTLRTYGTKTFTATYNLSIFGYLEPTTPNYTPEGWKVERFKTKNNGVWYEYVPFKRGSNVELLELNSLTLAERHGTFTISESPAS